MLVPELDRHAAEPFDKVCRNEIPPLLPAKPQVKGALAGAPSRALLALLWQVLQEGIAGLSPPCPEPSQPPGAAP